jgi:amino acid transporter
MIAVAFSVPLILRMKISDFNDYSCLFVEFEGIQNYTVVLGAVVIVPYVISYVLYAHIFYTVRRSSLDTGIQREGRLAKRIILITSTNLFFTVIPIVALSPYTGLTDVLSRDKAVLYTYFNTFAHISLGINSCLNPCLYAFRNEKFQKEFKRLTVKRQRVENINS